MWGGRAKGLMVLYKWFSLNVLVFKLLSLFLKSENASLFYLELI